MPNNGTGRRKGPMDPKPFTAGSDKAIAPTSILTGANYSGSHNGGKWSKGGKTLGYSKQEDSQVYKNIDQYATMARKKRVKGY